MSSIVSESKEESYAESSYVASEHPVELPQPIFPVPPPGYRHRRRMPRFFRRWRIPLRYQASPRAFFDDMKDYFTQLGIAIWHLVICYKKVAPEEVFAPPQFNKVTLKCEEMDARHKLVEPQFRFVIHDTHQICEASLAAATSIASKKLVYKKDKLIPDADIIDQMSLRDTKEATEKQTKLHLREMELALEIRRLGLDIMNTNNCGHRVKLPSYLVTESVT